MLVYTRLCNADTYIQSLCDSITPLNHSHSLLSTSPSFSISLPFSEPLVGSCEFHCLYCVSEYSTQNNNNATAQQCLPTLGTQCHNTLDQCAKNYVLTLIIALTRTFHFLVSLFNLIMVVVWMIIHSTITSISNVFHIESCLDKTDITQ